MLAKKELSEKVVYRFTDNSYMRYRPLNYNSHQQEPTKHSFAKSVSSIFGTLFKANQTEVPDTHKRTRNSIRGVGER